MNKHHSPLNQPPLPLLSEALEYKDMVGMLKPTIHVDEFASKMGDDADIVVVSFFVRSKQAATDLVNWFEKGYDWVLDADQSPGEIRPGRYLVYIEMRRRSSIARNLATLIDDLGTLTEHSSNSWTMHYEDQDLPFSEEAFTKLVPTSPKKYREVKERDLNEWRAAAGIEVKQLYERERDIRQLQSAAGI
jgi:hypothetical protein